MYYWEEDSVDLGRDRIAKSKEKKQVLGLGLSPVHKIKEKIVIKQKSECLHPL